jgi:hypothetical protein
VRVGPRSPRATRNDAIRVREAIAEATARIASVGDTPRLDAELLRDSMLAVSGTLNLEPYGPSFKPWIPPEANLARNLKG